jgi:hypothetical protein
MTDRQTVGVTSNCVCQQRERERERPSFAFHDYVTELSAHGHWMKDV